MCISLANFHTLTTAIYNRCFVCVLLPALTLPMSALGNTGWWFAGPVGCVGLDVEGVTGGRLQISDVLLQCQLTDSLLILHLCWVWGRKWNTVRWRWRGSKRKMKWEWKEMRDRNGTDMNKKKKTSGIRGGKGIEVVENKNKRGNDK